TVRNSPVTCERTETVWNASAEPMMLITIGIGFCAATAVVTGTGAPAGPPPRPDAPGVDWTASLPEQARDTTVVMKSVRARTSRTRLAMQQSRSGGGSPPASAEAPLPRAGRGALKPAVIQSAVRRLDPA